MDEKNRLFEEFDTKKLEELTANNLDSFRDQVFIEDKNRHLVNDLIRFGKISNQLSSSGPMTRTMKIIHEQYTTTGNKDVDLGIGAGEVWQLVGMSMKENGSGTATFSLALYDGSNEVFIAVKSTTTQEPVPILDLGHGPIFFDSNVGLRNVVSNTGGTSADLDLCIVRVR
jgi:hypothetical protein